MNCSTIRREWNPCKICKYLDNENFEDTCKECMDATIEDHPGFYPSNDFQQFLKKNDTQIYVTKVKFKESPIIILSDKKHAINNVINLFWEFYDVKDIFEYDIPNIVDTLKYLYKLNTIYVLPIDERIRNVIYNDEDIMSHYLVYLLYDDSNKRKSIKYKLDKRFYQLTY